MNYNERLHLKEHILSDLELLKNESWDSDVKDRLQKTIDDLIRIRLEGYDD